MVCEFLILDIMGNNSISRGRYLLILSCVTYTEGLHVFVSFKDVEECILSFISMIYDNLNGGSNRLLSSATIIMQLLFTCDNSVSNVSSWIGSRKLNDYSSSFPWFVIGQKYDASLVYSYKSRTIPNCSMPILNYENN